MRLSVSDVDGITHIKEIYTAHTLPISKIMKGVSIVQGNKDRYYNIACAFDIETTSVDCEKPYGFMYHWQFCLGSEVCFGRTWEEFQTLIQRLQYYNYYGRAKFAIYAHFLGFEFQFMRNFIDYTSLFARKVRSPLNIRMDSIEFRCSYYLSNMSFSEFCKNSKLCKFHKKGKDTYDYTKYRDHNTPLTQAELEYCYCDVKGLCECIETLMLEDTIGSIPLTSTGYVRREFRQAVLSNPENQKQLKKTRLSVEQYQLANKIKRGGNTHAQITWSGHLLSRVKSQDIKSSYPACMLLDKYPITKFTKVTCNTKEKFRHWIDTKACMFTFVADGVQLKTLDHIPYIDSAHCTTKIEAKFDNGRVLSAKRIEMSVTDIDWKIIENQYDFKGGVVVTEMHIAEYGMLPLEMRTLLLEYFHTKCELEYQLKVVLKGREHTQEYKDLQFLYNKFKNKINAVYGMCVTDITSPEIAIVDGKWKPQKVDPETALNKYYSSRNSFLSYQHGIWVTCHARRRLQECLDQIGRSVVYIDTDSIKYIDDYDYVFERSNKKIMKELRDNELDIIFKIKKDGYPEKEFAIGIWDKEDGYDRFITWGAKKYCGEKDGVCTVTVAGLSKEKGSEELMEGKGIEDFVLDKKFLNSGRTSHYYNDEKTHKIRSSGDLLLNGSNVAVLPATYTLGLSDEYSGLVGELAGKKGEDRIYVELDWEA